MLSTEQVKAMIASVVAAEHIEVEGDGEAAKKPAAKPKKSAAKSSKTKKVDEPAEEADAYRALIEKYGWKMKVLNFGAKISGKIKSRGLIRLQF